jgi:hypothetical protein
MAIPAHTRLLVLQRLRHRARERWPALTDVAVRTRGSFAYVDGLSADGETLRLCRLRYLHSAAAWGFAIYLASKDGYEESVLPTGDLAGSPEDALDCACGLYLNDLTAWFS